MISIATVGMKGALIQIFFFVCLVVTNTKDSGDFINIILPIFEYHNDIEEITQEMNDWTDQMIQIIGEQNNHIEKLAEKRGLKMGDFGFEDVENVLHLHSKNHAESLILEKVSSPFSEPYITKKFPQVQTVHCQTERQDIFE